jgi:hypothetical protein
MEGRVKIKASNPELYEEVRSLLDNRVRIYVASPQRGILSTDVLPEDLQARIEARGAIVTPEVQYDLEMTKTPF